jgi:hypothetical protein
MGNSILHLICHLATRVNVTHLFTAICTLGWKPVNKRWPVTWCHYFYRWTTNNTAIVVTPPPSHKSLLKIIFVWCFMTAMCSLGLLRYYRDDMAHTSHILERAFLTSVGNLLIVMYWIPIRIACNRIQFTTDRLQHLTHDALFRTKQILRYEAV